MQRQSLRPGLGAHAGGQQGLETQAQAQPQLLRPDYFQRVHDRGWKEATGGGGQTGRAQNAGSSGGKDPVPVPLRAQLPGELGQKGETCNPVSKHSPLPRLWSQPSLMTDTSFMVAA